MQLKELISTIPDAKITGSLTVEVTGIHADSRKVEPGFLFVAVPGTQSDGHQYIDKAIENGAVVIVCRILPEKIVPEIVYVRVVDPAGALGRLLSVFNGEPSSQLVLVGVTGTNGKTTIATLLYELFRKLGYKTGLLSTVCNYVDGLAIPATHTTPDPVELNKLLVQMVDAGCEYVFMEVSSHAVDQKRISGLFFRGGIFTNLTRDHLDYHKTVEAYRDAKKTFFDQLPSTAFALTNKDDKNGMFMLQNTKADKKTYSLLSLADFKGKIIETHFDGTEMFVNGKEVNTRFVGKFNAYNLLAVYGAAVLLEEDPDEVLLLMSSLASVAGRFQVQHSPKGYSVIVDYAHTPDALTNVLNAIHEVLEGGGNIITVVGCGGNRDKGKRPIMAQEAVRQSNKVILTSDNPRFEEPQDIIDDMVTGLDIVERKTTLCIVDRKEAIRTACMLARSGDVILIAGKGHEDYQEVKGVKHHFDDREIVEEIINNE
ncbi:MAG: UDP-N-acetylmuramoyl-L-alanyl-D-glutamate--2,6-diaminopimelate ligase [Dysgonamonadaceae bacterium]|jgi:UDP-N-acetylmuramoyl-L-alanyl-D-glutamate--2,6-diaminopimelate ligase|nr:UDP-N-acetylmuramoyl-L-alanyl-D-glutamate--2,6-diaminopimelate ligase [Dysgonamonadaceae bacterium]